MRALSKAALIVAVVVGGFSVLAFPASAQEITRVHEGGPSAAEDGICDEQQATITGSGVINGTSGNDVIVGSDNADTINGNGGDDVICGRGGPDTIHGNSGNDRVFGESGVDDLFGDAGNDYIDTGGNADGNTAHGGTGNDSFRPDYGYSVTCTINGLVFTCSASNHLFGDAGNDVFLAGVAEFHGGSGNDRATGFGVLAGDAGDDTLTATNFAVMNGGSGNDTLDGRDAVTQLDGGSARDTCFADEDDIVRRSCEILP